MKAVYVFPNGFQKEAESMYGWLRCYGFAPAWAAPPPENPGAAVIEVPDDQVSGVQLLAKSNPARFGNESEVIRRSAGDLRIGSVEFNETGGWK